MLVLSRRIGESIVLGDDIVVTVLDVRGDMVRIGIKAPRSVDVHRAELLEALEETNKQAASPDEETVSNLSEALRRRATD